MAGYRRVKVKVLMAVRETSTSSYDRLRYDNTRQYPAAKRFRYIFSLGLLVTLLLKGVFCNYVI